MSSKHTKGPWESTDIVLDSRQFDDESSRVVLVRSRRGDIAYVAHHATNGDPAEQHANAKLIAAAPELLEALIDLADWLAYGLNKAEGAEPTAEDHAACARVAAKARAAVAKATTGEA